MENCYNRGCGKTFDPKENNDNSCRYHPGEAFFHEGYKGWTCCNKKSVDFTEFLNIKGCTESKHSNKKPPEPEKPKKLDKEFDNLPITEQKPKRIALERVPFDSILTEIVPEVLPTLKANVDALLQKPQTHQQIKSQEGEIQIGTPCKNNGCTHKYDSDSNTKSCVFHPGVPVFHEGAKYWSCCRKKTLDFSLFVNQPGCVSGKHKWIKEENSSSIVKCQYDWHQTSAYIIVAIYAKLYHYEKSIVKVNPVRLQVDLIFPGQNDAHFNLDLELKGIIKVEGTKIKMYPTKVEITMPKAEAVTWSDLEIRRKIDSKLCEEIDEKSKNSSSNKSDVEDNLDDIETKISEI